MCGVFGFVGNNEQRVDVESLKQLAVSAEVRGRDAFGLAWVDASGRLRMYKSNGRIGTALNVIQRLEGARIVIGHCRLATRGAIENLNNHPHPVDGGWLVHNGMISDYQRICFQHDLMPVSKCDTEVLGHLIELAPGARPLVARVAWALKQIQYAPLSILALWRDGRTILARRGMQPLHWAELEGKGVYLGSREEGFPPEAKVYAVPNDSVFLLNARRRETNKATI